MGVAWDIEHEADVKRLRTKLRYLGMEVRDDKLDLTALFSTAVAYTRVTYTEPLAVFIHEYEGPSCYELVTTAGERVELYTSDPDDPWCYCENMYVVVYDRDGNVRRRSYIEAEVSPMSAEEDDTREEDGYPTYGELRAQAERKAQGATILLLECN